MTVIICMKTGCPHHSGPGGVCKKHILMLNEGGTCIEALRKRMRKRKGEGLSSMRDRVVTTI
jgi:hypothetical protein